MDSGHQENSPKWCSQPLTIRDPNELRGPSFVASSGAAGTPLEGTSGTLVGETGRQSVAGAPLSSAAKVGIGISKNDAFEKKSQPFSCESVPSPFVVVPAAEWRNLVKDVEDLKQWRKEVEAKGRISYGKCNDKINAVIEDVIARSKKQEMSRAKRRKKETMNGGLEQNVKKDITLDISEPITDVKRRRGAPGVENAAKSSKPRMRVKEDTESKAKEGTVTDDSTVPAKKPRGENLSK